MNKKPKLPEAATGKPRPETAQALSSLSGGGAGGADRRGSHCEDLCSKVGPGEGARGEAPGSEASKTLPW